ncbi:N-acetylglucosaminyldiphosphodolichol N-acetylglucosaminyltransferase catalytic subunit alg13 [Cladophialophora chaetospira]|uniref:UDP-N-acetylglucosamine transferase subunit ALG13 n=1 Tax=Cladophialophora chaetospira TaxID=386627 RepID=A0AA38WYJ4_9EURO|nr:N-acetylglucosaminyldiphosphodolichol N-acetylglucosaminyltransferase catalytic subunit alg13 [Cladophialophora chaetospira]
MAESKHANLVAGKRCFVTVGATAPFNSLVRAVLQPHFIKALHRAGYTQLRIQYGDQSGENTFRESIRILNEDKTDENVEITGFDFRKEGLREEMRAVKGSTLESEGIVISHAGSGSILDALRIGVPIVVVPNTDLLHNHQAELAEALAEQEYVIHGKVDDLVSSIAEGEALRRKSKQWPPLRSGEEKYKDGLKDVVYEEMGWQID